MRRMDMFKRIEMKEVPYKDAINMLKNGEVLYKINPDRSDTLIKQSDIGLNLLFHKMKGGKFGVKETKFCLVNDFDWNKKLSMGRKRALETHISKKKGDGFSWNIAYVKTKR
jgi:hypothetical protein